MIKFRFTKDAGSTWTDFQEAAKELSLEEVKDTIRTMLRAQMLPLKVWPYVTSTYSDYVIVQMEGESTPTKYYKYDYTLVQEGSGVELSTPVEVVRRVIYEPIVTVQESAKADFDLEFISLTEAKKGPIVGSDNKIKVKLVQPGWGASAYYSSEMLERDAKIFEGAKMYWNHQTEAESKERPEGDLDKLAAQIVTTPVYEANGPKGPGVYAEAQVFSKYKDSIEELAPYIGVSIRAGGVGKKGTIEGREGMIAESLTAARSVDFVTKPGAGGEVLELFEAAGRTANTSTGGNEMEIKDLTLVQLKESRSDLVELIVKEAQPAATQDAEAVKTLQVQLREADAKIAKLEERNMIEAASRVISTKLASVKLPEKTRTRLFKESLATIPTNENGALDSTKLEADVAVLVTEAQAELAEIMQQSGQIRGMGETRFSGQEADVPTETLQANLIESFRNLGYSEEQAKLAATGR